MKFLLLALSFGQMVAGQNTTATTTAAATTTTAAAAAATTTAAAAAATTTAAAAAATTTAAASQSGGGSTGDQSSPGLVVSGQITVCLSATLTTAQYTNMLCHAALLTTTQINAGGDTLAAFTAPQDTSCLLKTDASNAIKAGGSCADAPNTNEHKQTIEVKVKANTGNVFTHVSTLFDAADATKVTDALKTQLTASVGKANGSPTMDASKTTVASASEVTTTPPPQNVKVPDADVSLKYVADVKSCLSVVLSETEYTNLVCNSVMKKAADFPTNNLSPYTPANTGDASCEKEASSNLVKANTCSRRSRARSLSQSQQHTLKLDFRVKANSGAVFDHVKSQFSGTNSANAFKTQFALAVAQTDKGGSAVTSDPAKLGTSNVVETTTAPPAAVTTTAAAPNGTSSSTSSDSFATTVFVGHLFAMVAAYLYVSL